MDGSTTLSSQIAYIAEEESMIDIIPNCDLPQINFIRGTFGPFRPNLQITVPLWIGMFFKNGHKCKIVPPEWMSKDSLAEIAKVERDLPSGFTKLPSNYFIEITKQILDSAEDDCLYAGLDVTAVRILLKDIIEVRENKIRQGLIAVSGLDEAVTSVGLDNLTHIEINKVKKFFIRSMDNLHQLHQINTDNAGVSITRQATTRYEKTGETKRKKYA